MVRHGKATQGGRGPWGTVPGAPRQSLGRTDLSDPSEVGMVRRACRHSSVRLRDYSQEELGDIAARVVELSQAVPVVHAVMNNNYENQGQRNAKTLTALLKKVTPLPGTTGS